MSKTEISAAQSYLELLSAREIKIVNVKVPSGFVFEFQEPNTMGILLGGELPTGAASEAADEWEKDGIGEKRTAEEVEAAKDNEKEERETAERVKVRRQRLVDLSYSPKIVIGIGDAAKNEISMDKIPDTDLDHLFRWVAAGGSAAAMLILFPQEPSERASSGTDSAELGTKSKRSGKAE